MSRQKIWMYSEESEGKGTGGGDGGPECVVAIVILLLMSWQSLLAKFSLYHFRVLRLSQRSVFFFLV